MNYDFPIIRHINDVRPAIDNSPEFIIAEKDDYFVVNYVVMNEDTFPPVEAGTELSKFRRECRGLVFDKQGNLINRRFHKFFNVNEREETRLEAIDWSKPHHILEKLDGSMVSPCPIDGHIRWMTKMGITDTSMEAEVYVAKNYKYTYFAFEMIRIGATPIFEWCSNKNRIVLDYPEDQLVLLAIRDNTTGKYTSHPFLVDCGEEFDIPVVKAYSYDSKNILEIIRQQEDTEGVVIRFQDGHMVKVKSDWYVRIHKVKSALANEREVVNMILNEKLDDIIPVLPPQDVEKIKSFQNKLMAKMHEQARILKILVDSNRMERDRKTFAIECSQNFTPLWRGLIFSFWDSCTDTGWTFGAIRDTLLKHCQSNQAYRKIKEEFLKDVNYE